MSKEKKRMLCWRCKDPIYDGSDYHLKDNWCIDERGSRHLFDCENTIHKRIKEAQSNLINDDYKYTKKETK